MKLLDLERKGNIVRFYFGHNELERWWGDDWDDSPYQHNAGTVYNQFICADVDAVFPFDAELYDACCIIPAEQNISHCPEWPKNHYLETQEPILLAVPNATYGGGFIAEDWLKKEPKVLRFWLGMSFEDFHVAVKGAGGFLLDGRDYESEDK